MNCIHAVYHRCWIVYTRFACWILLSWNIPSWTASRRPCSVLKRVLNASHVRIGMERCSQFRSPVRKAPVLVRMTCAMLFFCDAEYSDPARYAASLNLSIAVKMLSIGWEGSHAMFFTYSSSVVSWLAEICPYRWNRLFNISYIWRWSSVLVNRWRISLRYAALSLHLGLLGRVLCWCCAVIGVVEPHVGLRWE